MANAASFLLERHLNTIAIRMGDFLHGFENPEIHSGTIDRWVYELGRLFTLESIQSREERRRISYREAIDRYCLPAGETGEDSPVGVLLRGIGKEGVRDGEQLRALDREQVRTDLVNLLRVPLLRFYLRVPEISTFRDTLSRFAEESFPISLGDYEGDGNCPACGTPLEKDDWQALICLACQRRFESFTPLGMITGVRAVVSFELLRRLLDAGEAISTYEEEGSIQLM